MDLTHIHLLLNHFPVIGTLIGFGLFVLGLLGKSDHLQRASLVIFLGISLLTVATYISGNAAAEAICDGSDSAHRDGQDARPPERPCAADRTLPRGAIQVHEDAAFGAFGFMELMGAFAWFGLWQYRRNARVAPATLAAVFLLAAITIGLMARAANFGGEIRHSEIRTAQDAAGGLAPGQKTFVRQVGALVAGGVPWGWATCESLHFIGLCLLFGVATIIDLRMLGLLKGISFPALHRLLPWGILGYGLNLVTGMLFFVASPWQYTYNGAFQWKITLILLAGLNVVYFTVFDEPWALEPGSDAPLASKIVAATAIFLVFGVMYCGRMLPFLGNAF